MKHYERKYEISPNVFQSIKEYRKSQKKIRQALAKFKRAIEKNTHDLRLRND